MITCWLIIIVPAAASLRKGKTGWSFQGGVLQCRHRYLSIEQGSEERVDKFIERVERSARTCRWGPLEDALIVQIVIRGIHNDKL